MRIPAVLLLVVGSVTAGRAGDGPAELQGRWDLVSVSTEGKDYPLTDGQPRCEVVGDRLRYGGEEVAVLTADPSASPKAIDLRFGSAKPAFEGTYAREGETLKVCLNRRTEGVKERPHLLSTRGHETWRLLVFRRAGGGEAADPGFVGLALGLDPAKKEVVIEDLLEGTPAAKSGLKMGDVLLAIDGAAMTDLQAAIRSVRAARPGQSLPLRIRREGAAKEIKVRVGLMPLTLIADLE